MQEGRKINHITAVEVEANDAAVVLNAIDKSIIQDQKSGLYYVFGSHIAVAQSPDLIDWQNFTNGYATTDNNYLRGSE